MFACGVYELTPSLCIFRCNRWWVPCLCIWIDSCRTCLCMWVRCWTACICLHSPTKHPLNLERLRAAEKRGRKWGSATVLSGHARSSQDARSTTGGHEYLRRGPRRRLWRRGGLHRRAGHHPGDTPRRGRSVLLLILPSGSKLFLPFACSVLTAVLVQISPTMTMMTMTMRKTKRWVCGSW